MVFEAEQNPMIQAKIRLPLESFDLETKLSLKAPITALFGASGAGKTSFLEALAGLRAKNLEGEILSGEELVFSSQKKICLSPEKRHIGYVPQDILLFPHMNVRQNILFGARNRKTKNFSLSTVLEILEIEPLLNRNIFSLSGGEKQRVALARALMIQPRLLLLDEPLAALDTGLKTRILPYLSRIREAFHIPIIYVSHDIADVMTLCDEVVVLDQGKVMAQGLPKEVLSAPTVIRRFFYDSFENIMEGKVLEQCPAKGVTQVQVSSTLDLWIPFQKTEIHSGKILRLGIPAEDILVSREAPGTISARNILKGRIETIESYETFTLLRVSAGVSLIVRLTLHAADHLKLEQGQTVYLIIKSHSIHRLD